MKKNRTILLVEDDLLSLGQTLSELLVVNGYEVHWSKNGVEALQYLDSQLPEIIVCDLMMPVMSGEELFLKIRNFRKFDQIPFIMITADLSFESKIKQLQNGVNDFINKPFKIQELVLKIQNFLDYKQKVINQSQSPVSKISLKSRKSDFFFDRINQIIITNIKSDITVEKLAKEVFVSKSTLDKKLERIKSKCFYLYKRN